MVDPVLASRLQFALTAIVHIVFPVVSMGLAPFLVYFTGKEIRTGEPVYEQSRRFWTRIFAVSFVAGSVTAPFLPGLFVGNWVAGLLAATVALAAGYAAALARDRHYLAFATAGGLVYALVAVVALLLYPVIDPAADLTVEAAAVSTLALNIMTIGAALLFPLIFAYFGVLYDSFAGPVDPEEGY